MKIQHLFIVIVFVALIALVVKYAQAPVVEVYSTPDNIAVPAPTPIVAENPEGEADPNRMKLDMKSWQWMSTLMNDGTKIIPKNSDKFLLTFKNDGTFSASTDCNGIGGNYVVGVDKKITFSNMMSTLMFCEGSNENDFRKVLEGAGSYFFTSKGELIVELKYDSGTATFR